MECGEKVAVYLFMFDRPQVLGLSVSLLLFRASLQMEAGSDRNTTFTETLLLTVSAEMLTFGVKTWTSVLWSYCFFQKAQVE